jgi:hypothetical protein
LFEAGGFEPVGFIEDEQLSAVDVQLVVIELGVVVGVQGAVVRVAPGSTPRASRLTSWSSADREYG